MSQMPIVRLVPVALAFLLAAADSALARPERELISSSPIEVLSSRDLRSVESLTSRAFSAGRGEIDLADGWTLDEILTGWPGIDVVGQSRYGQEVRVNTRGIPSGFGTQRTLVLLDGRPLTDEYLGNVDLAQYPLAAIDRVEAILGPASALYGTNALGGVVNLVPRRGGLTPTTEIAFEGGSFGTVHGSLAHGRRFGDVDLFLTLDGTDTNGYLRNDAGDPMDWSTKSGFLNLGWANEKVEVRAYLSAFGGRGTDADFDRELTRGLFDVGATVAIDPERDAYLSLRLYRSQLDQTLDWFFRPSSDYEQTSHGAILAQSFRVHPAHLLTGGVEWRLEDARVEEAADVVDEDATTGSIFLQNAWSAAENLTLVGGLRYDDRTGIDGEISWRAGATWDVVDGTTLRAAVGRAFRAPTISDRFLPETAFFGMVFAGNPDLDPEILHSVEAGVDQRIVDGLTASVTGFAIRAEDFWDFLPVEGEPGVLRPQNITEVHIHGVEVVVQAELGRFLDFLENFHAFASYTFTDATYEEFVGRPEVEGNRIDDNVRHRGTVALAWRHPDGHAARLGVVLSGDRYTDPENSADGKLDGFAVVDFTAEAQVTEQIKLTLSLQNALNSGYQTRPEFREPPRAIFAGVRIDF